MSSDWTRRFEPDRHTVALYRFDEGASREAHDACGDAALTLRARQALWGRALDGGGAARFESVDDDANVFVGPLNHPKLMLKPCTREWTVEAWIRYTGPWGGFARNTTYAHLCGSSEEGYHLSHIGVRGGFQFLLEGGSAPNAGHGLLPTSRYEGNFAGKDPNHDVHYIGPRVSRPLRERTQTGYVMSGGITWPGSSASATRCTSCSWTARRCDAFSPIARSGTIPTSTSACPSR